MIGIVSAVSLNGVIGVSGILPFHYPDDLRYFKETTSNSVVIMGRKTFESIGKPLPKRENIVITSQNLQINGVKCFRSISAALNNELNILRDRATDIWFIGGASIYQEAMLFADEIRLTLIPEHIESPNSVKFPFINPIMFELCGYIQISETLGDKLLCATYKRKIQNSSYNKIIESLKHL